MALYATNGGAVDNGAALLPDHIGEYLPAGNERASKIVVHGLLIDLVGGGSHKAEVVRGAGKIAEDVDSTVGSSHLLYSRPKLAPLQCKLSYAGFQRVPLGFQFLQTFLSGFGNDALPDGFLLTAQFPLCSAAFAVMIYNP